MWYRCAWFKSRTHHHDAARVLALWAVERSAAGGPSLGVGDLPFDVEVDGLVRIELVGSRQDGDHKLAIQPFAFGFLRRGSRAVRNGFGTESGRGIPKAT